MKREENFAAYAVLVNLALRLRWARQETRRAKKARQGKYGQEMFLIALGAEQEAWNSFQAAKKEVGVEK